MEEMTRHLTDEQLLDLAESGSGRLQSDGSESRPEAGALLSHIESCRTCAEQVESMRLALKLVAAAPEAVVPEPSPLFWDHLSARVREAVAAEPAPGAGWFAGWNWHIVLPSAAVAALAVAVFLRTPPPTGQSATPADQVASISDVPAAVTADPDLDADSSALVLLSDLAGDFEWDDVSAGLVPDRSAIDRAVTELTPAEQIELHRLLNEELARWKTPGA